MTRFHGGQEVEVFAEFNGGLPNGLTPIRKAKIVRPLYSGGLNDLATHWQVQFPDASRAVFAADYIRAIDAADTRVSPLIPGPLREGEQISASTELKKMQGVIKTTPAAELAEWIIERAEPPEFPKLASLLADCRARDVADILRAELKRRKAEAAS